MVGVRKALADFYLAIFLYSLDFIDKNWYNIRIKKISRGGNYEDENVYDGRKVDFKGDFGENALVFAFFTGRTFQGRAIHFLDGDCAKYFRSVGT